MPARARTSLAAIVEAGREILERDGVDGLTMQAVAEHVGVRAPSLYKRLRDRSELVRLIADDAAAELAEAVDTAAAKQGDARRRAAEMCAAFRAFAHGHPAAYGLLFSPVPEAWRPDAARLARATDALFRVVAELSPAGDTLEAARLVVAWLHGFVSMELAGAFRLGGDLETAFAFGVDRIIDAIGRSRSR